jgi:hypothetical protein
VTLSDLKAALLANICEAGQSILTTAQQNRYINMAMHHVATWIASLDAGLLLTEWSGSVSNATDDLRVTIDLSSQDYPRVVKIVEAERTDLADNDSPSLEIIAYPSGRLLIPAAAAVKPQVFVYNETIGFIRPANAIGCRVVYVHGLPDMDTDTNRPGETGATNDGDEVIPLQFQTLIATYAAVLALTGENSDASQWRAIYEEQRQQILAMLPTRVRTPGKG